MGTVESRTRAAINERLRQVIGVVITSRGERLDRIMDRMWVHFLHLWKAHQDGTDVAEWTAKLEEGCRVYDDAVSDENG